MNRSVKIIKLIEEFVDNDEYYSDSIYVFHTTTSKTLETIKHLGKLIPTDHVHFGKLYPNRLHISTDHRAHVRMIVAIADEKSDFEVGDLYTLIINYPCRLVTDDSNNILDIEYKDLKPDNNAGYSGYDYYTNKDILISKVERVMPFSEFRVSREY